MPLCAVLCRADVYFVLKGKLFLLSLYKHERSQGSDMHVHDFLKNWFEGYFQKKTVKIIYIYIYVHIYIDIYISRASFL